MKVCRVCNKDLLGILGRGSKICCKCQWESAMQKREATRDKSKDLSVTNPELWELMVKAVNSLTTSKPH